MLVSLGLALLAAPGLDSKLDDSAGATDSMSGTSGVADFTLRRARELSNWTTDVRRELHRCPELLYSLDETSALVRARLDALGIPYEYPVATNGIVAQIGTGASPCVGLRADMDALPITEEVDVPFRSESDGKMHACGHDAHTAMLLAAAKMLKEREAELGGTVKLIFQPAEEGGAGGLAMVQAGVLSKAPKVERVFALHVWPTLPTGTLATRAGTIMAAAGFYHAVFEGHGGHAALPHTVTDPFMCAGPALSGLQTVVSRNLAPTEAGVVSTTFIHGGSAYNIIPKTVEMGDTLRSLTKAGYRYIDEKVADVLKGAAAMGGCGLNLTTSSLELDCLSKPAPPGAPGACTFPPTVNARSAFHMAKSAALDLVGRDRFVETAPTMGGEDFAYLLERVPGAMIFLGIGDRERATDVNLHNPRRARFRDAHAQHPAPSLVHLCADPSPQRPSAPPLFETLLAARSPRGRFQMDESQLHLGAAMHVELAMRSLFTPLTHEPCAGATYSDGDGWAQCAEGTMMEAED